MINLSDKIRNLPKGPGIYMFSNEKKEVLYVGKSVSLKDRVASYFSTKNLSPKTKLLVKKTADITFIKVFSEFEALLLEAQLIKKHQPFFNSIAKDDKSPLYLKITNDPTPLVTTTRLKTQPLKGEFVKGPFPSSKITKEILRTIRKIFPFCQHKNPKKPCLYVHLGLCPYPYRDEKRKQYLQTIKHIKDLLSGKIKKLTAQLEREMNRYAAREEFENAQSVKEKIAKIQYLTSIYHQPNEFLKQPTLVDDLATRKVRELKKRLNFQKLPKRIECYDVSNISGQYATGSMAVFINGQPAPDQYRRFRIKFSQKPDDYRMIQEILARRFKNPWPHPQLIVIDGGKGQLHVALKQLKKTGINCQIISIAKRFEEIYTPQAEKSISLPKDSQALALIQSVRDEAHRFAITYHRYLRSKNLFN